MPLKPFTLVMVVAVAILASTIWAMSLMPWQFAVIVAAVVAFSLGLVMMIVQMIRDRGLRNNFRIKLGFSMMAVAVIIVGLILYSEAKPVTSYHPPGPTAVRVIFLQMLYFKYEVQAPIAF